jgi:hypothetical protein
MQHQKMIFSLGEILQGWDEDPSDNRIYSVRDSGLVFFVGILKGLILVAVLAGSKEDKNKFVNLVPDLPAVGPPTVTIATGIEFIFICFYESSFLGCLG